MTWVIVRDGSILYRGSYDQCIEAAEGFELALRRQHADGTEMTPKLAPGVHLLPADMLPSRLRRRAA